MGLFGNLFDKKYCSVCGGEIGLLGNRKLEDGNLCKNCAEKLSPFFSERRHSTVASIKEQLDYREANREAVEKFHVTRSFGTDTKVLIDEDAGKFMVTRAHNLKEANPDVLDFSQVTGCDLNIDEDADEEMRKDSEGNYVSYNPPRFTYRYDFEMILRVNSPYFDTISFQLNSSGVETNPDAPVPASQKPDVHACRDYCEMEAMGNEIKTILMNARQQARDKAAPKKAMQCPLCGATTTPDARGCCEFCGGAIV